MPKCLTLFTLLVTLTSCSYTPSQDYTLQKTRARLLVQEANAEARQFRDLMQELLDIKRTAAALSQTQVTLCTQALPLATEAARLLATAQKADAPRARELSTRLADLNTQTLDSTRKLAQQTQRLEEFEAQFKNLDLSAHKQSNTLPAWALSDLKWSIEYGHEIVNEAIILRQRGLAYDQQFSASLHQFETCREQMQALSVPDLIHRLNQVAI